MAVTIYDIAKEVNTSAVTVSLALRGSKRVSPVTKKKIADMARQLGYQPNPLARGLIGAKTKTFAFVFNYSSADFAHDLSYMELFHVIAQEASAHEYKLFVHSSINAKPIADVYAEVMPYGVDGIILGTNINNDTDRKALQNAPIPTVLLGRDFYSEKTTGLVYGGYQGAVQAVEHLVADGHRRIAFAGKSNIEASTRRLAGYASAMAQAGLPIEEDMIIESGWDVEAGEIAGVRLAKLDNPPTAVIAGTDLMAIGVVAGLKEEGMETPGDVSVIGFDNLHISRFTVPALTSIDLCRGEIAKNAIHSLIDIVKKDGKGQRVMIPSKLVVRNSTSKASC